MLNRVILIGRLTRDVEMKYTPSGIPVAQSGIAVDRPKAKDAPEKETDFIELVFWRQRAEFAANYLGKGRLIAIEGRLQIRNWTDQSGNKRKSAEVVVDEVRGLDRPREDTNPAPPPAEGGAQPEFHDPFADE